MPCQHCDARLRLERDLHNGPQQRLMLLAIKLARLSKFPAAADAETLLAGARTDLSASLADLRDLAQELRA